MNATPQESLTDDAYRQLHHDIVTCQLEPGTSVSQNGLIDLYGFTKSAVRAAMSRLSAESLLIPAGRGGHKIPKLTISEVKDIFRARKVLEPAAIRDLDRNSTNELVANLRAIKSRNYVPSRPSTFEPWIEANAQFHQSIVDCLGSARVSAILADLIRDTNRLFYFSYRFIDRSKEMSSEHESIVTALQDNKLQDAAHDMATHIAATEHMLVDLLVSRTGIAQQSIHPVNKE